MNLTGKIGLGTLSALGIGSAVIFIGSTVGAGFGALGGEILDHIPYLNQAIPKGVAYLGNAFSDSDTTQQVMDYLNGNLDKVGACMGFLGGFVKSTLSNSSRDSSRSY